MVCHRLLLLLPPAVLLLLVAPLWAVICPGGKVKCTADMTCCPLANHEFGCCTYPEAQCCHDRVHCCPHDMKCDERHQACLKNGFPALSFTQTSVKPVLVEEEEAVMPDTVNQIYSMDTNQVFGPDDNSKTCPDGHLCPTSFTCCKMFRGSYGCCPYSGAMCCKDGFHCCPHGSQCDPYNGGCENGSWLGKAAPLMRVIKPSTPKPVEVADPGGKCPDGHPCLEKFTCCKVQDGGYGCCPYTDAICCADFIHCCPKNTTCNTSKGTCDRRDFSVAAFSLATMKLSDMAVLSKATPTPASQGNYFATDNICPDRRTRCSSDNTCCQTNDGSYGCCPFSQATCCSDHESCCPHGYQCAAGGLCQRMVSLAALPFLSPFSVPQKPTNGQGVFHPKVEDEAVNCPDGSQCTDQTTCCNVSPSRYGCCPMPLATCCGDMKHCCPHGYWCADEGCERVEAGVLNQTLITLTSN